MSRMGQNIKDRLEIGASVVSNVFIDNYMADANGEYVKVYLYLLRRGFTGVTEAEIADALNDTEADVKRALAYWKRIGVLEDEKTVPEGERTVLRGEKTVPEGGKTALRSEKSVLKGDKAVPSDAKVMPKEEKTAFKRESASHAAGLDTAELPDRPATESKSIFMQQSLEELSSDPDFSQLLYIAQQYLKKVFTPRDGEVFANLYGRLGMSAELLEYLVEYCAQNSHTSLRYIEKVAISWHEKGLKTVEEAKAYARTFTKDSFAVMKAFGLTGRSPAETEYVLLEKWYRSYGFTKDLVVEACNRTMTAIHSPSFQYADRILTDWKESGVRTMRDVAELDRIRQEQKAKGGGTQQKTASSSPGKKRTANRFHNLEEHGYDYDKMVWSMINPEKESGK